MVAMPLTTTAVPPDIHRHDGHPSFAHWRAWGTSVTVGVRSAPLLPAARRAVAREIVAVDAACNRFRDESDVTRANRGAGEWVTVGPLFLLALQVALGAAVATGGAVDPTVGSALVALGYDRDYDEVRTGPPKAGPLPAPRALLGWRSVAVDHRGRAVRVEPGAALDLGATAKALCVDRAARRAAEDTGTGVLVDIGGDLAIAGDAPDGGWEVSVQERARSGRIEGRCVVALAAGALATSGTTGRCWDRAGARLHHIIDPRTGLPASDTWAAVTVAAPTCVDANTAATAAVVWGEDALFELAQRGCQARLVRPSGAVVHVGGWPCP